MYGNLTIQEREAGKYFKIVDRLSNHSKNFSRTRVIGGRFGSRPGGIVYGRVVHKIPTFRVQDIAERNRAFEEVARMYGSMNRVTEAPRRRVTAFRLGGGAGLHMNSMAIAPQTGSFQHLKVSFTST